MLPEISMSSNLENLKKILWGPPRKFSTEISDRKVTWLELFYDLVYVIVISRITHHLSTHLGGEGIIEFLLLFIIVFWSWFNGSMYYDIHGTRGIRNLFMTLWQMLAVASLAVTLSGTHSFFDPEIIYTLVFLEIFITYLWWSVGIYDKEHRRLNRPYTLCYILATIFILSTLWVEAPYQWILLLIAIVLNYLPPFLSRLFQGGRRVTLSLSSSMLERLGLFTTIVFGEGILGIVNGMSEIPEFNLKSRIYFLLCILIVFSLWYLFFTLIGNRRIEKGLMSWQLLPILYIPTLASLGVIGAAFSEISLFLGNVVVTESAYSVRLLLGVSISIFLISIVLLSYLLEYPEEIEGSGKYIRPLIIVASLVNIFITYYFDELGFIYYLLVIVGILISLIIILIRWWLYNELKQQT